jgi:hypothetical protein
MRRSVTIQLSRSTPLIPSLSPSGQGRKLLHRARTLLACGHGSGQFAEDGIPKEILGGASEEMIGVSTRE